MNAIIIRHEPHAWARVNQVLRGGLADELRNMRTSRKSFMEMSHLMYARGFILSPETLRHWCEELGVETPMQVTVPSLSRPE